MNSYKFDVIVIGAGHAGCEAAAAAANLGANVLLATHSIEETGLMPCNPSIGGVGKGIVVREIDALNGLMGRVIDESTTYSRVLNRSKGQAVWGPRAQADRKIYAANMKNMILDYKNISLQAISVGELLLSTNSQQEKCIAGVVSECGSIFYAPSVVIATGTFLNGTVHIGKDSYPAGRRDGRTSVFLAEAIKKYGIRTGRLKTGTPPRLCGQAINWSACDLQLGDAEPIPFSFLNDSIKFQSVNCYITRTNDTTHQLVKKYQKEHSALGINSVRFENVESPRYCMSIHDKVKKFPEKSHHQIFLEPEDVEYKVIYPSGISTSLSLEKQQEMINTINGLEKTKILLPGYLIDYDFVFPSEISHTLETKKIKGLFLAGQINGTTGYEEAGAQGLIAGVNAALSLDKKSFFLYRDEAYIGVMIDDIVASGDLTEPYRLFTTRAEHRLTLRPDNADFRLTEKGIAIGLVSAYREQKFKKRKQEFEELKSIMENTFVRPSEIEGLDVELSAGSPIKNVFQLLSYRNFNMDCVRRLCPDVDRFSKNIIEQVLVEAKYSPYLKKKIRELEVLKKEMNLVIPDSIDYSTVSGLGIEAREKLSKIRPKNLAMASVIYGIDPVNLLSLISYIKKKHKNVPRET